MAITLNAVKFAHDQVPESPVLDIAHWSVDQGQQVFVHGPSGSGKSTLLNVISGLAPCTGGQVSVLEERLDLMSGRQRDRFRANHIGYVFQRFNLIPYLSAVDNIELATHFSNTNHSESNQSLLDSLGVDSSEWHRPTSQLSMGQQQRVAIARALVNRPEILIADEPTSSLDQTNRDRFLGILLGMAKEHNITLLFVSHDMSLTQHFDNVQALSDFNKSD
ncbi:MAG: ABC transporter ATP-binding protein [Pseudomonadota bacterium]